MQRNKKIKLGKSNNTDFEKKVMAKIKSGEIAMRPKWYFVAGSFLGIASLAGLITAAVFFLNLTIFFFRSHSPMKQWKLASMITEFPWWVPAAAITGIVLSVWLLKKYDFSYKKNFWVIAAGFIVSIIMAALLIDAIGLNENWSRRSPMRRFYIQFDNGQKKNYSKSNKFDRLNYKIKEVTKK